ncbi:MAG: AmmeMemoRadiSam system protein B [Candidatus Omnitrophota bacterium]
MADSLIRNPVVSGQFYSNSAQRLNQEIKGLLSGTKTHPEEAIGCVLPHAGYAYSGKVAAKTVACLQLKDNAVILGPNHTGSGAPFSIMTEGCWLTPIGKTKINSRLAKAILNKCEFLSDDTIAHLHEHSLEVELPLLQYFKSDIKIVPIVVSEGQISTYKDIGRSIAQALKEANLDKSTLIIASSDMTHYEPADYAQKQDNEAIAAILELDEDELVDKVKRLNISMCGYIPTAIMLTAAKILGAKSARLISYQTSGEVTGDYSAVVGYAGIVVE